MKNTITNVTPLQERAIKQDADMQRMTLQIHEHMLPSFWVDYKKHVHVISTDYYIQAAPRWAVIGFVRPKKNNFVSRP